MKQAERRLWGRKKSILTLTVVQMLNLQRAVILFCICLVLGSPTNIWSQSTDQNSDKIQALQKRLDEMKSQMDGVQAEINALSLSSAASKTATAPASGKTATTQTQHLLRRAQLL